MHSKRGFTFPTWKVYFEALEKSLFGDQQVHQKLDAWENFQKGWTFLTRIMDLQRDAKQCYLFQKAY